MLIHRPDSRECLNHGNYRFSKSIFSAVVTDLWKRDHICDCYVVHFTELTFGHKTFKDRSLKKRNSLKEKRLISRKNHNET